MKLEYVLKIFMIISKNKIYQGKRFLDRKFSPKIRDFSGVGAVSIL